MSSTLRHRRGDCKPVTVKYDTTYPIEQGDLLFLDPVTSKAKPASAMVDPSAHRCEFAGTSTQHRTAIDAPVA